MTFRDLAERVLRLRLDPDPTPEQADRVLLNLGALAARRYARFAHEKHPQFDPELVKLDLGRDDFDLEDVGWGVAWRCIIAALAVLYRNELPPMPGAATLTQWNDGPGIRVRAYEFKPEHWRQRAEDYRAAMLLLSRMAGESAEGSGQNPKQRSAPAEFVHSECFRSISWYGQEFAFTSAQAAVIQLLFKAWQVGTPDCAAEYLYEGRKLVDLFRAKKVRHPAWGILIVDGKTRGTKRLNLPKID